MDSARLPPFIPQAEATLGLAVAVLLAVLLAVATAVEAVPPLTDSTIADAVADELQADQAVPAHLIDVAVADGIVNLGGRVDNLLAKERARQIAMIVKGVRAVVNEITVFPRTDISDEAIQKNVHDALLLDPATEAYEVEAAAANGTVTLTGVVDSWQEKRLCAFVAKGVRGVTALDNQITVSPPQNRSDPEIRFDVEKALERDAHLDGALIAVTVKGGEVTLNGIVGSAAEKYWALVDAYVEGVTAVDNTGLRVARWARDADLKGRKYVDKSDAEILTAVSDALLMDPRVAPFGVYPEMAYDNRTIVLRGTVDNLLAKRAAAQDARNTVGVHAVDNRIKVRTAAVHRDGELASRVHDALARNPFVDGYQIRVAVTNGAAHLYGTVDSFYEKAQADDTAAGIEGIILVENNLSVRRMNDPYYYNPYLDRGSTWNTDGYGTTTPREPVKSDAAIAADIRDQLWWSPFVDEDDVKVAVETGRATLTGTVQSWSEYNAATTNAYDGGAVRVDNHLVVKYP